MAYKIILKKRFTKKIINLLAYLELNWGNDIARNYILKLDLRLHTLTLQPYIGSVSKKIKDVRGILITKHNRIYYRIQKDTIEIINLYDTRIGPGKNIYK